MCAGGDVFNKIRRSAIFEFVSASASRRVIPLIFVFGEASVCNLSLHSVTPPLPGSAWLFCHVSESDARWVSDRSIF